MMDYLYEFNSKIVTNGFIPLSEKMREVIHIEIIIFLSAV